MSRFALVIGNNEYLDPKLARLVTPIEDVHDLAHVLSASDIGGFDDVRVLIDKSVLEVRRVIARFFAGKQPDDLLLLYFSGHGVRDDRGLLYLAVQDTEHDLLNATAIPAAFIAEEMDRSRSRRQVLILDCCHSGAFSHGAKGATGVGVGTGAAFEGTGFGRMVLTATDATQYAWEGDQVLGEAENSVFTRHLVAGLGTGQADLDGDGRITLDELYDYVYEQVVKATSKQTPRKFTYNQQGDVVIARNPRPVVKPAELPAELRQAIESPLSGVREGAVRELARLLRGSHRGLALAALEALAGLAEDDSRRVSQAAEAAVAAHAQAEQLQDAAKAERQASQPAEPAHTGRETAAAEQRDLGTAHWEQERGAQTVQPALPGVGEKPQAEQERGDRWELTQVIPEKTGQGRLPPEGQVPERSVGERPAQGPGRAKQLMVGWTNTLWLAMLLAVVGGGLGSAVWLGVTRAGVPLYGLVRALRPETAVWLGITRTGLPVWVAEMSAGGVAGLTIALVLWLWWRLPWTDGLALAALWAVGGILGGQVISGLYDVRGSVSAWMYGQAVMGALRGAAAAIILARHFRHSPFARPFVMVMAGSILGAVLPVLVFSRTAYWDSPTIWSTLFWGVLEGAVAGGVLLWQVNQVASS